MICFWSLGLSFYYMVYGTRGTEVYAEMSILNTMEMFAKLAIMGFAGGMYYYAGH